MIYQKSVIPGAIIIKLIAAVIYGAKMFVPGKPLQPLLGFVGKAGAYPSEEPFRCSTLG
jgi:hypothetical protein